MHDQQIGDFENKEVLYYDPVGCQQHRKQVDLFQYACQH